MWIGMKALHNSRGTATVRIIALLSLAALAAVQLFPGTASGDEGISIAGRVVNLTSGGADPANLEVTLHVFREGGSAEIFTAMTDDHGRFEFREVEVDAGSTYAVTASYQDVLYSRTLDPQVLDGPVELPIYEAGGSIDSIRVGADVLLIRGIDGVSGSLAAFAIVTLSNEADRTFVPDLAQPGMMSFLRFSVTEGATDIEVSSDLPGGEVIHVGTGFAISAPVTPGAHQVTYRYRFPYEGGVARLTRSFPMGAETFRLLMEDDLGEVLDSGPLIPLPAVDADGQVLRAWEANGLSPGTRLTLEIEGLSQPGTFARLGDALNDGPYLKVGIPGAVGAVLAGLLLYSLFVKHGHRAVTPIPATAGNASVPLTDGESGTLSPGDIRVSGEQTTRRGGLSGRAQAVEEES